MRNRLEHTDEKLDELVESLVTKEIQLNLIPGKDFHKRFKEVKKFMVDYYMRENAKNLPQFTLRGHLRIFYITIMGIMRKMFPNGVWCNREQLSKLYKQYLKDPMSIIFLPNHQSHIDYIILHLIAIRFQISTPTVIAGDNLNVAVFGGILKSLGAIFIKRSFNNELYTERNLANYIEFTLLNKIHFEVFIEGTRSRDGKLLLPKYGILKTLTNIYLKQREEEENNEFDLLMQPLSITYERIYEADGYLNELMGKDKKQESVTTIFKNGITHFFSPAQSYNHEKLESHSITYNKGSYDNSTKHLHGKIFVKLGNFFKLSEFIEDDLKNTNVPLDLIPGSKVNLKKLGFKILHEINRALYLPEVSIIGSSLNTYYNLNKLTRFPISLLIPTMRLLMDAFQREETAANNKTNMQHLSNLSNNSDEDLIQVVKEQVPQFFRDIKVNLITNEIIIDDSMELLYYKNLTVHIIIHKSLASFILLSIPNEMRSANTIHKMFYIFTGFLKNEFLFDYDYNPEHQLSNILESLIELNKISKDYKIIDYQYLNCFSEVVKPFLESYLLCIYNIHEIITTFNEKNGIIDFKQLLIDDKGIDFPHTKSLLKLIQSKQKSKKLVHIESTNKQYLLSCLYYLNNLQLIDIIKNKARTKAYVVITNGKDLLFVYKFLRGLLNGDDTITNISVGYMIDIIDKNFDRNFELAPADSKVIASIADVKLRSRL